MFKKLSPNLVAEVVNTKSNYFGEVVYLTEVFECFNFKWYCAENLTNEMKGYKVFFKEDELEVDTGLDYE